jgi:hypothetical protein
MIEPESAHSLSAPLGSASRRLKGMVLMFTELLPGNDELVADLSSHDRDDDLLTLDIIEDPQVTHAQLKLRHGIGT